MNPYLVEPPFCFHFSGGRTSGYLLKHVLDAYSGVLPPSGINWPSIDLSKPCPVVFTNTGKEFEETLVFIEECSQRWGVQVHWVEWINLGDRAGFREVDFRTASRKGEPFEALINRKMYLPNVVQRLCTQHLKIHACDMFLREYWGLPDYLGVIGVRYDEPKRWKVSGPDPRNSHREVVMPLRETRITESDVLEWWSSQPFDLQLRPRESNCDLCFLKANVKRIRIMVDHPEKAAWWIEQERKNRERYPDRADTTAGFRAGDRKDYQTLYQISLTAGVSVDLGGDGLSAEEEDLIECNCTD